MQTRLGLLAVIYFSCLTTARADFFVIDLRSLGFQPAAVNSSQMFAGSRDFPGEGFRAFRWDIGSGFTNLGTLGGATSSASAINESGWVAGSSLFGPTTASHAFLWRPGIGLTDIGTLGGNNSSAAAVNSVGWVVGNSQIAGNSSTQAFRWRLDTQTITPLGTLGGNNSSATGVNAAGVVVGTSDVIGGVQPFVWTETTGLLNLGGLGGPSAFGRAFGINDLGTVVGRSNRGDGTFGAFVWQPGTGFTDLGTFGGNNSVAFGINNRGEVVGTAQNAAGENRAFLWDAINGLRDLNDLVTNASGFTLTSATGISSTGDALAESTTIDGTTVYLVSGDPNLFPINTVPAPLAFVLFGIALPALGLARTKLSRA